jgi:hypothetical protein
LHAVPLQPYRLGNTRSVMPIGDSVRYLLVARAYRKVMLASLTKSSDKEHSNEEHSDSVLTTTLRLPRNVWINRLGLRIMPGMGGI